MDGMIAQNKGWALLRVKKVKTTYDGPTKEEMCSYALQNPFCEFC